MIISKFVKVKIIPKNFKYFSELGYKLPPLGSPRHGFKYYSIDISVDHLEPRSNIYVDCVCDKCGEQYSQRYCRDTDVCYDCRHVKAMTGNKYGSANKGKSVEIMRGENHPRWNPNKTEYNEYASKVRRETSKHKPIYSTWENFDKIGLCGIPGAYQLDHKVSVAYGFYNKVPPEIIGSIDNLEIITWEENRSKSKKSSIDLWDLLK